MKTKVLIISRHGIPIYTMTEEGGTVIMMAPDGKRETVDTAENALILTTRGYTFLGIVCSKCAEAIVVGSSKYIHNCPKG